MDQFNYVVSFLVKSRENPFGAHFRQVTNANLGCNVEVCTSFDMANVGESSNATSPLIISSSKRLIIPFATLTAIVLLALYFVEAPLPGLLHCRLAIVLSTMARADSAAGQRIQAQFKQTMDSTSGDLVDELVSEDGVCRDFNQTLSIITPLGRNISDDEFLQTVLSIKFCCITRWIIVYDTTVLHDHKPLLRGHDKIVQIYYHFDQGTSQAGHAQRNRALVEITDGLVYNLDDDNIMHPHFWDILPQLTPGCLTTFDQQRATNEVLPGDNPTTNHVDTGSFVVDRDLIGQVQFDHTQYAADGLFVEEVLAQHPGKHIYIPEVAAYYNYHKQQFNLPV